MVALEQCALEDLLLVVLTLTPEERRRPLDEQYQALEPKWTLLQKYLTRGWGDVPPMGRFKFVTVVEQHRDGVPHMNVIVHSPALAQHLREHPPNAADVAAKRGPRWFRDLVAHVGWGPLASIGHAIGKHELASYVGKTGAGSAPHPTAVGEVVKLSQLPVMAPRRMRRLRSTKGWLPPARRPTHPDWTGKMVQIPTPEKMQEQQRAGARGMLEAWVQSRHLREVPGAAWRWWYALRAPTRARLLCVRTFVAEVRPPPDPATLAAWTFRGVKLRAITARPAPVSCVRLVDGWRRNLHARVTRAALSAGQQWQPWKRSAPAPLSCVRVRPAWRRNLRVQLAQWVNRGWRRWAPWKSAHVPLTERAREWIRERAAEDVAKMPELRPLTEADRVQVNYWRMYRGLAKSPAEWTYADLHWKPPADVLEAYHAHADRAELHADAVPVDDGGRAAEPPPDALDGHDMERFRFGRELTQRFEYWQDVHEVTAAGGDPATVRAPRGWKLSLYAARD